MVPHAPGRADHRFVPRDQARTCAAVPRVGVRQPAGNNLPVGRTLLSVAFEDGQECPSYKVARIDNKPHQHEARDVLGLQSEVARAVAQEIKVVMFDEVYRAESRRVLATLIRLLGDFDLAEEALQEAFAAALEQWPRDGVPPNPRAWLISAGRFRPLMRFVAALDWMRRWATWRAG